MHLCGIPEEAMNQLHIPNGVPLVYNIKGKCITLLEDEEAEEQISIEDFGPAAKYLFRPCELDDDFFQPIERIEATAPPPSKQKGEERSEPSLDLTGTTQKSPTINVEEEIEVITNGDDSSSSAPPTSDSTEPQLSP